MAVETRGLTIGEFGRRTGLSAKALRLYDVSGLLPPAEVDAISGYRRYTSEQIERARRISLLRQLDMPLAVVAEVLAGTDTEAALRLERWWAAQEASMRARRGSLEYLREQLNRTTGRRKPHDVTLRDVPETKLATISRTTDQQHLVDTITAGGEELRRFLDTAGATPTGESWVIYHGQVTPDSEATVEMCAPFTGTVDPAGPVVIRVEPAQTVAACTITRGECFYPTIMLAYDDVAAWTAANGRPMTGPPREIYFVDWCDIGDDDPFAHIAVPV
ncbi:MAG TPA: MerR family transcriptional regulator [Micromonosporaceae bacterium]|jgi:DNA-binding transcriptional MerR regulator